jgi:hypothetical protein
MFPYYPTIVFFLCITSNLNEIGGWQTNEERNTARQLRNAYDLFVSAHRVEFVKRLPLFAFPTYGILHQETSSVPG